MRDMSLIGNIGIHRVDISKVREQGRTMLLKKYKLNSEQACTVELEAFRDSNGDMVSYLKRLMELGEFISFMRECYV